jgi:hypothetical protein
MTALDAVLTGTTQDTRITILLSSYPEEPTVPLYLAQHFSNSIMSRLLDKTPLYPPSRLGSNPIIFCLVPVQVGHHLFP